MITLQAEIPNEAKNNQSYWKKVRDSAQQLANAALNFTGKTILAGANAIKSGADTVIKKAVDKKDARTKKGKADNAYREALGYMMGINGKHKDANKAKQKIREAAENDHPIALRILAGNEPDEWLANILYLKAAEAGDAFSYYILAQRFSKDDLKVKINFLKKATEDWRQPNALFELGQIYWQTSNDKEKRTLGKLYIYLAAAQANTDALAWLKKHKMPASFEARDFSLLKQSKLLGKAYLDSFVERLDNFVGVVTYGTLGVGSGGSQYNVCLRQSIGLNCEKDSVAANYCLKQLSDDKHLRAMMTLGKKYFYSIGIQQDFTEAAKLFHAAAKEHADPEAFFYLSEIVKHQGEYFPSGWPEGVEISKYTSSEYIEWAKFFGSEARKIEENDEKADCLLNQDDITHFFDTYRNYFPNTHSNNQSFDWQQNCQTLLPFFNNYQSTVDVNNWSSFSNITASIVYRPSV